MLDISSVLWFLSYCYNHGYEISAAFFDWYWYIWLVLRNIPHVHLHEKRENKDKWHGAEIQVVIEGNWTTYRVSSTHLFPTFYSISLKFSHWNYFKYYYIFTALIFYWWFFLQYMQSKILHYMRQMAVITPYAQFLFKFISDMGEWVSLWHIIVIFHSFPKCFIFYHLFITEKMWLYSLHEELM